jgi:HTH-type transcriptional regulator/antitoxin HipB
LTLADIQLKSIYLNVGYFEMSIPSVSQRVLSALQLGQLLVSTRKRQKLTQTAVASRVGLSQNRISYLEKHPDEISFKQLLSWCSALELDLRLGERDTSDASSPAEW